MGQSDPGPVAEVGAGDKNSKDTDEAEVLRMGRRDGGRETETGAVTDGRLAARGEE